MIKIVVEKSDTHLYDINYSYIVSHKTVKKTSNSNVLFSLEREVLGGQSTYNEFFTSDLPTNSI